MADDLDPPPEACIDDAQGAGQVLELWNPHAAVLWSVLFTPLFGAILHLRNWEALELPHRAARARGWMIASALVLPLAFLLAHEIGLTHAPWEMVLTWLLVWYFGCARQQVRFMKERFGRHYRRRGWLHPVLSAVVVVGLGFVGLAIAIGIVTTAMWDVYPSPE